jgi:hypothetical protein
MPVGWQLPRYAVTDHRPVLPTTLKAGITMTQGTKTAAERQAAYRHSRSTAGENGERRINTWVSTGAALALARLARHHRTTHREMLERLIVAADDTITAGLDPRSRAWDAYFLSYAVTHD